MPSELNWNGQDVSEQIRAALWERIKRAVAFLWTTIESAIGVHNPPPYKDSSKPGEPPKKRTGFLQANTIYELQESLLAGRVGVLANAVYGKYLEFGTKKMAARPFILSTLKLAMGKLRAIMGAGWNGT